MFKFQIGQKARDVVTGFTGTIIGRCEHITTCNTYGLQPPVKADGDYMNAQWFDEPRLEVVRAEQPAVENGGTGPGPAPQPTRTVASAR